MKLENFTELVKGAYIAQAEFDRIQAGLEALTKDAHAPRELTISVRLHGFNEYPKHVTVGKNDKGEPIVKIVNNADEERAVLPVETAPATTEQVSA